MSGAQTGGSFRKTLGWVILEAALVVFGLVLAVLVGQWQQTRADQRAADVARSAIQNELTENRILLAAARDYHAGIAAALYPFARPGGGEPDARAVFAQGFLQPAQVSQVAWDAAGATGALSHFDARETLELARQYELLGSYRESADALGEIIYRGLYEGGIASLHANWRGVLQLVQTASWQECRLLASLDELLGPPEGGDEGQGAVACAAMMDRTG